MKEKKNILTWAVAALFLFVLLAQFVSCEKYVLPELTISQDTIIFSHNIDSAYLDVHSNVIWEIETPDITYSDQWIIVKPNWADGDTTVVFKTTLNEGPMRQTQARIFSETIERNLLLIQQAAPAEPDVPDNPDGNP
ncbi:MAG: BACON domain-containing protein [Bacteroidales bacterium]|jgi:hypothetical protein|nr:BACON domain-containing protein [Bacteroidales bacterium]